MILKPCVTCGTHVDVDNPFGHVPDDEVFCEEHQEVGWANLRKAKINQDLISDKRLDIFDKFIIIEGWFKKFNPIQRANLVRILEEKIGK